MGILKDVWFPKDGASALGAHAYTNRLGVSSISPVTELAGTCELTTNPDNPAQTVLRTMFAQTDARFSDGSLRTMMSPITPTASDPICDWAGYSATRRWYRFCFRADVWPEEAQAYTGQQPAVVWQLHDQADSGDTYWEPPLWLEDDARGGWILWNTADPAPITTVARVHRPLYRFKRTIGKWEHFVIFMRPSWTSGDLKVWHDHRPVFQETGVPNCLNHDPARGGGYNFLQYGIYGGKTGQLRDRSVLHMGCQIGDEAYTTYDAFMAACGSSSRELPRSFDGRMALA